jgi:hypothetical protein
MKNNYKKKMVVDLELLEQSVVTRIADLEWMIEWGDDRPDQTDTDASLSDRRKAYDKLKYIRKDIANLKKDIIDGEA